MNKNEQINIYINKLVQLRFVHKDERNKVWNKNVIHLIREINLFIDDNNTIDIDYFKIFFDEMNILLRQCLTLNLEQYGSTLKKVIDSIINIFNNYVKQLNFCDALLSIKYIESKLDVINDADYIKIIKDKLEKVKKSIFEEKKDFTAKTFCSVNYQYKIIDDALNYLSTKEIQNLILDLAKESRYDIALNILSKINLEEQEKIDVLKKIIKSADNYHWILDGLENTDFITFLSPSGIRQLFDLINEIKDDEVDMSTFINKITDINLKFQYFANYIKDIDTNNLFICLTEIDDSIKELYLKRYCNLFPEELVFYTILSMSNDKIKEFSNILKRYNCASIEEFLLRPYSVNMNVHDFKFFNGIQRGKEFVSILRKVLMVDAQVVYNVIKQILKNADLDKINILRAEDYGFVDIPSFTQFCLVIKMFAKELKMEDVKEINIAPSYLDEQEINACSQMFDLKDLPEVDNDKLSLKDRELITKFQNIMKTGELSDQILIEAYSSLFSKELLEHNPYAYKDIELLVEIKKKNPDFCMICVNNDINEDSDSFDYKSECLNISSLLPDVLNHELTHAFHWYTKKYSIPSFAKNLTILESQTGMNNIPLKYMPLLQRHATLMKLNLAKLQSNADVQDKINSLIEVLDKNSLKKVIEEFQLKFKEFDMSGINPEVLEYCMKHLITGDEFVKSYIKIYQKMINEQLAYKYFCSERLIFENMIDALSDGLLLDYSYEMFGYQFSGHGSEYFEYEHSNKFAEILAIFGSMLKSPKREEYMLLMESLVGKELTNELLEYYKKELVKENVMSMDINEIEDPEGISI